MTAGVYLVRAENGLTKIGQSANVYHRVKALQAGSPMMLSLAVVIETRQAFQVEQALHQEFAERRRHGEWFELNENDIAEIQERATHVAPPCDEASGMIGRIARWVRTACDESDACRERGDEDGAERWFAFAQQIIDDMPGYQATVVGAARRARTDSVARLDDDEAAARFEAIAGGMVGGGQP